MMVWEIQYFSDKNIVVVKTHGDIPYYDLTRQFEEAVCLAQEKGTNQFLFDDTDLHIQISILEIYEIPPPDFFFGNSAI